MRTIEADRTLTTTPTCPPDVPRGETHARGRKRRRRLLVVASALVAVWLHRGRSRRATIRNKTSVTAAKSADGVLGGNGRSRRRRWGRGSFGRASRSVRVGACCEARRPPPPPDGVERSPARATRRARGAVAGSPREQPSFICGSRNPASRRRCLPPRPLGPRRARRIGRGSGSGSRDPSSRQVAGTRSPPSGGSSGWSARSAAAMREPLRDGAALRGLAPRWIGAAGSSTWTSAPTPRTSGGVAYRRARGAHLDVACSPAGRRRRQGARALVAARARTRSDGVAGRRRAELAFLYNLHRPTTPTLTATLTGEAFPYTTHRIRDRAPGERRGRRPRPAHTTRALSVTRAHGESAVDALAFQNVLGVARARTRTASPARRRARRARAAAAPVGAFGRWRRP